MAIECLLGKVCLPSYTVNTNMLNTNLVQTIVVYVFDSVSINTADTDPQMWFACRVQCVMQHRQSAASLSQQKSTLGPGTLDVC